MRFVLIALAFVVFAHAAYAQKSESPLSKQFCVDMFWKVHLLESDIEIHSQQKNEIVKQSAGRYLNAEERERWEYHDRYYAQSLSRMADITTFYSEFCREDNGYFFVQ